MGHGVREEGRHVKLTESQSGQVSLQTVQRCLPACFSAHSRVILVHTQ